MCEHVCISDMKGLSTPAYYRYYGYKVNIRFSQKVAHESSALANIQATQTTSEKHLSHPHRQLLKGVGKDSVKIRYREIF